MKVFLRLVGKLITVRRRVTLLWMRVGLLPGVRLIQMAKARISLDLWLLTELLLDVVDDLALGAVREVR